MQYVISDIHGCYEEYIELLHKIHFSSSDHLYVLGDAMDRGKEPMKVILDLMSRENVTYILGNHDYFMFHILSKENKVVNGECGEDIFSEKEVQVGNAWLQDGGSITYQQFFTLSKEMRQNILNYMEDTECYKEIKIGNKTYLLMHAGGFIEEDLPIHKYTLNSLLSTRADYTKRYYTDKQTYVVTGHTPTPYIREDQAFSVYEENGHIAIDCGCVFGGRLSAYCLDTGKIYYVNSKNK